MILSDFQTLIRKVVINGDSVLYNGANYKETDMAAIPFISSRRRIRNRS